MWIWAAAAAGGGGGRGGAVSSSLVVVILRLVIRSERGEHHVVDHSTNVVLNRKPMTVLD